jgi:putative ABC transport system substrate-binding protein
MVARHRLPAIYEWREFAEAGGLASYGTNLTDAYRFAGMPPASNHDLAVNFLA